jgi:[acyl-carrier-protein] S-malonyltransferase
MQPAVDGMAGIIGTLAFEDPSVPVIGNTTAGPVATAGDVKSELLNQLCSPVQWHRSIDYMINNGVTTFIEIGPGKVLTGLVRRIKKEVETVNLNCLEAINSYI